MKILMATMSMDIGGAETHLLELCKELKRRGHEVFLLSKGGRYADILEGFGVRHYTVPMHNKNPLNLIKSYRLIKRTVRENDIKLIHAHARIPMLLCGILAKRLKIRFVTTAHFTFNLAWFYKRLTNWGEKTLAVSEDLKRYLMDNYQLPEADITVTVNGIDTDIFSKGDDEGLRRELGLKASDFIILNLNRMDGMMTRPTHALLNGAAELHIINPNVKMVLVGKGDDLERVKARADEINGI
jgi:glycosyltransferase involved in cell wall biosynthesis